MGVTTVALRTASTLQWILLETQTTTRNVFDDIIGVIEQQRHLPFGGQRCTGAFSNTDHAFLGKHATQQPASAK